MFDYLLNQEQLALRDEVRDFVKSIPRQMILDMDSDTIKFPREFLEEAGRRNLFGCRYPEKWGGRNAQAGFVTWSLTPPRPMPAKKRCLNKTAKSPGTQ